MLAARSLALLLAASLALAAAAPPPLRHVRARRQLADDNSLQPLESGTTWADPARARSSATSSTSITTSTSTNNTSTLRSRRSSWPSRSPRQATTTDTAPKDDIPVFDRNKVSLDFPGNLFGPSVSLLIRTTKIVGEVIQNSAVRYQTFLRLFRPLFRGPFEIKGLDPPTTTTTTTTTARPTTGAAADNEVRRRRQLTRHA